MGSLCQSNHQLEFPMNRHSDQCQLYFSEDIDWTNQQRQGKFKSKMILPFDSNMSIASFIRYHLIYSFYFNKYSQDSSRRKNYAQHFFDVLGKNHESQEQQTIIAAMRKSIQIESCQERKSQMMLNYAIKHPFILKSITKICLQSEDPRDIGHIIFPISSLHQSIKSEYQNQRKVSGRRVRQIFVVVALDDTERNMLMDLLKSGGLFSFSVFMQGFTSERMAIKKLKQLKNGSLSHNYCLFTIQIPFSFNSMQKELNHGYSIFKSQEISTIQSEDVIINVMNTFQVTDSYGMRFDLEYGSFSRNYLSYYQKSSINFETQIQLYEFSKSIINQSLQSQSCLLRVLGNVQESIKCSTSILQTEGYSYSVLQIEKENMIKCYLERGEYEQAKQIAESFDPLKVKAKLMQIYFKQSKFEQARALLNQLTIYNERLSNQTNVTIEIIEFISAQFDMRDNLHKQAMKKLENILQIMQRRIGVGYEIIAKDVIAKLYSCRKQLNINLGYHNPLIEMFISDSKLNLQSL